MDRHDRLLEEHRDVTRRYFLQLGAAGVAGLGLRPAVGARTPETIGCWPRPIAQLEYLTPGARVRRRRTRQSAAATS